MQKVGHILRPFLGPNRHPAQRNQHFQKLQVGGHVGVRGFTVHWWVKSTIMEIRNTHSSGFMFYTVNYVNDINIVNHVYHIVNCVLTLLMYQSHKVSMSNCLVLPKAVPCPEVKA